MPADLARVEKIFTAALEKEDTDERADYLQVACSGDGDLLARVEALLAAHVEAGSFLELHDEEATASFVPVSERPGTTIGRYKLLEQIGEGGFGVVFMAEQERPVRRRAALKIIKLGMDTKQVVARFEAERQALAMMDHPNIAKVLDAGATDTGRPYFVMELVRGVPITEYCDQARLTTDQRLALFQSVCAAVQHAHQKGVIHRDLKPSNVMVTMHDDKPVPKVIDFGVAKATQGRLTERTLFTEFRAMIGTPSYMSPEQAQMSGLDVDTRSDIYSLGVLLYELLTGTTPIDTKHVASASYDDLRRIICEEEPPKPSARLSTLTEEQLTILAHQRHCEPTQLAVSLRNDLDWIVMRCLEKDRSRRYQTANSLAADSERYLNNEPVEARPPSAVYRLRKFARRNKVAVLTLSAVILAVAVGLTVATFGFLQAHTEAIRSQQVAKFLKDMLSAAGPGVARGRDTTLLREVVDKTAQRINGDLRDQPAVEAELLETLGNVYRDLGIYARAEDMFRKSLHLRIDLYGESNELVAETFQHIGENFWQQRRNADAEKAFRQALAIRRNFFGEENADVAASLYGIAETLRRKETKPALDESISTHQEALAIRRRLLGNDHPDVARSLVGLGIALQKTHSEETLECFREALEIQRRALGSKHPDVAYTLCNLGLSLAIRGKHAEGEEKLREALRIQQKVLGDHRDTAYTLNFLGSVLSMQGKLAIAEEAHRSALEIQKKVLGEHADEGVTLCYLGEALRLQGRPADAVPVYKEAFELRRKLLGDEHPYTVGVFQELIDVLRNQANLSDAETVTRQYLAALESIAPDDWVAFNVRSVLGGILLEQERYVEAEGLLLSGCNGLKKREHSIPPDSQYNIRDALIRVIQFFESTERHDQAEKWKLLLGQDPA